MFRHCQRELGLWNIKKWAVLAPTYTIIEQLRIERLFVNCARARDASGSVVVGAVIAAVAQDI